MSKGLRKPADDCYKPDFSSALTEQDREKIRVSGDEHRRIMEAAPRLVAYGERMGWVRRPGATPAHWSVPSHKTKAPLARQADTLIDREIAGLTNAQMADRLGDGPIAAEFRRLAGGGL